MSSLRLPPRRSRGPQPPMSRITFLTGLVVTVHALSVSSVAWADARPGSHTSAIIEATVPSTIPAADEPLSVVSTIVLNAAGAPSPGVAVAPSPPASVPSNIAAASNSTLPAASNSTPVPITAPMVAATSPAVSSPMAPPPLTAPVTTAAPTAVAAPAIAFDGPLTTAGRADSRASQPSRVKNNAPAIGRSSGAWGGLSYAEAVIIGRESRGRAAAKNPRSSAFGVGQLLAGNRVKYAPRCGVGARSIDYGAQLCMMRAYIDDRYGSAARALAFRRSHGFY